MPAAVLAFDDESAALAVETLRTALLGGAWPPGGRRALFQIVDALREPGDDELLLLAAIQAIGERGEGD